MAKKGSTPNPRGFEKSAKSNLRKLEKHRELHPNDRQPGIPAKIKKCKLEKETK